MCRKNIAVIAFLACLYFAFGFSRSIQVVYGQEEVSTVTATFNDVTASSTSFDLDTAQSITITTAGLEIVSATPTSPAEFSSTPTETIQVNSSDLFTPTANVCFIGTQQAETCADVRFATPSISEIPSIEFTPTPGSTRSEYQFSTPTLIIETPTGEPEIPPALDEAVEPCVVDGQQNVLRSNLIVKFSPEGYAVIQTSNLFGDLPLISINQLNSVIVSVTPEEAESLMQLLQSNSEVLYVEPDSEIVALDLIPSDPGIVDQNYLDNINAFAGWDLSTGLSSTVIAILDTGVDLDHADLVDNLLQGIDLVNNTNTPQDDNGHGTRVAGIAAAESDNAIGIAGIDWNAMILPVKVLDSGGNGSFATVAQGIVWAVDHGSNIINLSLGGTKVSDLLEDAINYAIQNNVLVVASSGNNSQSSILYPARYDAVLAVGATTDQNEHATFSNYGEGLDVSAPGVGIYSTSIGGGYAAGSGTSFSAPQVSGLAAILCGIIPLCPIDQIEAAIVNSALDLGTPGWDPIFGSGLIQMDAAIRYALEHITPTVMPTNYPTQELPATPTPTNTLSIFDDSRQINSPTPSSIPQGSQERTPSAPTSNPNADVSIADTTGTETLSVNNGIEKPISETEFLMKKINSTGLPVWIIYPSIFLILLILFLFVKHYIKKGGFRNKNH